MRKIRKLSHLPRWKPESARLSLCLSWPDNNTRRPHTAMWVMFFSIFHDPSTTFIASHPDNCNTYLSILPSLVLRSLPKQPILTFLPVIFLKPSSHRAISSLKNSQWLPNAYKIPTPHLSPGAPCLPPFLTFSSPHTIHSSLRNRSFLSTPHAPQTHTLSVSVLAPTDPPLQIRMGVSIFSYTDSLLVEDHWELRILWTISSCKTI